MFTLTYSELDNQNFMGGLRHLAQERLALPISYNVIKIIAAIETELKVATKMYQDIIKRHADLNEKGEVAFKDNVPGRFVIAEEKKPAFDAELAEWRKIEFKVERHKLPMEALTSASITPVMLAAIMLVVDEPTGSAVEA